MAQWIIGLILIVIGFSALFEVNIFRFVIPLFLIWLGWTILSKDKNTNTPENPVEYSTDGLNEVYVFSETKKTVKSQDFTGGKIVAVFGGADIDLSAVKTKEKVIRMELEAVFGGVRIRVPKNWEVDSVGVSAVLGGFDNRTDTTAKKDVKLLVSGAAILGGIKIYH